MGEGSELVDCEEAAAARRLQQKTVLIAALIDTLVANYIPKACRQARILGAPDQYLSYRFRDLSGVDRENATAPWALVLRLRLTRFVAGNLFGVVDDERVNRANFQIQFEP